LHTYRADIARAVDGRLWIQFERRTPMAMLGRCGEKWRRRAFRVEKLCGEWRSGGGRARRCIYKSGRIRLKLRALRHTDFTILAVDH